jgi:uncharacterized membrane protein YozB (DUF420 family)
MSRGFLGTGAPLVADVNLLLQLAMGAALLIGAWLARRKRFVAHGICQTAVLLLNLVPITAVMWPSFHGLVLPRLSKHLHSRFYAVATIHGALGAVAELFGLYIALAAGTNLLPRRLRFERWKLWMRVELALWWLVLISGVVTYGVWYGVPHLP